MMVGRNTAHRWVHPADAKLRDVGLLAELCQWLVRANAGIAVGMRDAIPRLELTSPGGVVVDVRVDQDGQAFVCRPSFQRHSTCDVKAAADALAAFVLSCDGPAFGSELTGGAR